MLEFAAELQVAIIALMENKFRTVYQRLFETRSIERKVFGQHYISFTSFVFGGPADLPFKPKQIKVLLSPFITSDPVDGR